MSLKTAQSLAAARAIDVLDSSVGLVAINRAKPFIAANIDAAKIASFDNYCMPGSVIADLLMNNDIVKPMPADQLIIWNLGGGWEPYAKHRMLQFQTNLFPTSILERSFIKV